jgi:hypothetical protein
MDEETHNWPIPDQFVTEFDMLKYSYQATPLPLFHDRHLVEPSMANEVMNGAMVEAHFRIHQWHIQQFDSFQATVEGILILRPAPRHHTSAYKLVFLVSSWFRQSPCICISEKHVVSKLCIDVSRRMYLYG